MSALKRVIYYFVVVALLTACGSAPTSTPMTTNADSFNISVAQYIMDSAGFHEMATALSETQVIDPEYLSTVNGVNKVLGQAVWPPELNDQAQAFTGLLGDFAAALEADNVTDSIELSETVHDAQHELSHSIDHWLEANAP